MAIVQLKFGDAYIDFEIDGTPENAMKQLVEDKDTFILDTIKSGKVDNYDNIVEIEIGGIF